MIFFFFFFQEEDGIRDYKVTGVQTCALPISSNLAHLYIDISTSSWSAFKLRPAKIQPAKPITKETTRQTKTNHNQTNHDQTITKPTMTKPKPTIKTSHPRYLHGVWGGAPFQKLFHFLTLFPAP